jgi:hypothetical protein
MGLNEQSSIQPIAGNRFKTASRELWSWAATASVVASYIPLASRGQKPIIKVGTTITKAIVNSLGLMSPRVANAGIRGPKNTLLHILNKYNGVRIKLIAAKIIVITLKPIVKLSLLVIPRNTVISLTKPLMPGKANDARQVITNNAKVTGKTLASPPILGIDRVFVRS